MQRGWLGLVLLGLAGCGQPYQVVPVSGTITLDGAPLAQAQVTFQPVGTKDRDPGPGSSGVTGADGRYTLQLLLPRGSRPGAVVGKHRVMIYTHRAGEKPNEEGPVTPERIPEEYNINSTLTYTVPAGGTTTADFHLRGKH